MSEPGKLIQINEYLQSALTGAENAGAPTLKGGGGDGTSGDMEARVKALEDKFERIDSKLGTIAANVGYVKGKLESSATRAEVVAVDGKVNTLAESIKNLPSTGKLATLLAIAVGALTIISKWSEITGPLAGP